MGNVSSHGPSLVMGRITAVHGTRGWLKVRSYTKSPEALISYMPWWLQSEGVAREVCVDDWKFTSQRGQRGLVIHIQGLDDRDQARGWCGLEISISADRLPRLGANEHYWYQLIGLSVTSHFANSETPLGRVTEVLATGANDVLVVLGDGVNSDKRQRLVPYVRDFISSVNLEKRLIEVQWDPDF
ncbi:MAG: ribosome maturation factor RimM [Porticoccaceae bacterium]|nr:ribosome maturation factor RimM [Porticoccaceae bacterium]